MLEKWNLEIFINVFAEYGWTDIKDWKEITLKDMKQMGMKKGHMVRFNRLFKQYNENNVNTNMNTVYAIRSISSGNYLTENGYQVLMTDKNPKYDESLHFKIVETRLDFALKGNVRYLKNWSDYLFGNKRPSMWKLYGDSINDDLRFNFKITQTNNGNFAIQSLFDGTYLDGRDNVDLSR